MSLKERSRHLFSSMQQSICEAIESVETKKSANTAGRFRSDEWARVDTLTGDHGGGGLSRVLSGGAVFEQGGVNFSAVHGTLPPIMQKKLEIDKGSADFFATGVSLVIHPFSPRVPTVHANFRYFEVDSYAWFGGGADLTPYVLYEDDAIHFHEELKKSCDPFSSEYYPLFKKECDQYFFIPHRKETRGVGGVFFDYLGKSEPEKLEHFFNFTKSVGESFVNAYLPIVEKRMHEEWTPREKEFQLLRRGRYVEFNLVYDRGTQFGLATGGRTESILMSLPPEVRWQYENELAKNESEERLMEVLRCPVDWLSLPVNV